MTLLIQFILGHQSLSRTVTFPSWA